MSSHRPVNARLRLSLCCAVLLAFMQTALQSTAQAADNFKTLPSAKPLSDFSLRDQHGQAMNIAALKGRWSTVLLGFTSCPDVCPMTLTYLEAARAELGLRTRPDNIPQIVFVAVDPERDGPLLANYLAHFHPQYVGLTGHAEQLQQLVKELGGFYRLERKRADGSYNVVHSSMVFVLNPAAEVVAEIYPPFHAHNTAEYLMQLIRGRHDD